jgi:hypothetical protein
MPRGRRPRFPSSQPPSQRGEPDLPALTQLERFTHASLHQWLAAKAHLDTLQRALYFELEPLRQRNEARLRDALLSQTLSSFEFDGWSRVIDYRYGLEPLSVAGSLKGEGGRFNIGRELSPAAFTAFPDLYVAEDYETAFRERFAGRPSVKPGALSAQELALRSPGSFTQVRLRGDVPAALEGELNLLLAALARDRAVILTAIRTPPGTGQAGRLVAFLAGLNCGSDYPFDLTGVWALDDRLAEASLDYLNYDQLGIREVHRHLPDGGRVLEGWIEEYGLKWVAR